MSAKDNTSAGMQLTRPKGNPTNPPQSPPTSEIPIETPIETSFTNETTIEPDPHTFVYDQNEEALDSIAEVEDRHTFDDFMEDISPSIRESAHVELNNHQVALAVTEADHTALTEQIVAFEPDPQRKQALWDFAIFLDANHKQALLESLQRSNGATVTISEIAAQVEQHIKRANNSRALAMREEATEAHLSHYGNLMQRIQEVLGDNLRDGPLTSLKIDGIRDHTLKLNADLHTLCAGIFAMQDVIFGRETTATTYEQPIDIPHMLRLLTTIAYGTKTWASSYQTGLQALRDLDDKLTKSNQANKILTADLSQSADVVTKLRQEADQAKNAARSGVHIITNGSWYLTSTYDPSDEDGTTYISPRSLALTDNAEEALEFATEQDANVAFDLFCKWYKTKKSVKKLVDDFGFKQSAFFIGSLTLHKVKGAN